MSEVLSRCNTWLLSLAMVVGRRRDEQAGASLVEYALLVALIAVVCIGAISFLGGSSATKLSSVGNSLQ